MIAVEHAVQPLLLVALFAFIADGLAAYPGWARATALSLVICLLIIHETVAVPQLWCKRWRYQVLVVAVWLAFILAIVFAGTLGGPDEKVSSEASAPVEKSVAAPRQFENRLQEETSFSTIGPIHPQHQKRVGMRQHVPDEEVCLLVGPAEISKPVVFQFGEALGL